VRGPIDARYSPDLTYYRVAGPSVGSCDFSLSLSLSSRANSHLSARRRQAQPHHTPGRKPLAASRASPESGLRANGPRGYSVDVSEPRCASARAHFEIVSQKFSVPDPALSRTTIILIGVTHMISGEGPQVRQDVARGSGDGRLVFRRKRRFLD
jgi:hypothetical protein